MSAPLPDVLDVLRKSCRSCLLWRPDWQSVTYKDGVCVWFLKKLQVPRPVPADVAAKGCANWQAIPAQRRQEHGEGDDRN